jgi:hypothetical protein
MATLTVPITLKEYWYEDITREEALRRLDGRNLDPETRAEIERYIPELSHHFLTFEGTLFREFLDWGDGLANLLLILPMKIGVNSYVVQGFVDKPESSGVLRTEFTFDLQRQLFEDGKAVPFKYSNESIELNLDVTFVIPAPEPEPERSRCCRACEWVHSRLHIHGLDPLCCLGCCANIHT